MGHLTEVHHQCYAGFTSDSTADMYAKLNASVI